MTSITLMAWPMRFSLVLLLFLLLNACQSDPAAPSNRIQPDIETEATPHDTDDPAVWINHKNPALSLILGTDKESDGGLYVYALDGKIIHEKSYRPLRRPNNVDVEYGFQYLDSLIDIAAVTEREALKLRIFSVPEMQPIDGGGIPIFEGETGENGWPMGIALYKKPGNPEIYVIAGRKFGPSDSTYIWQYLLSANPEGRVTAQLVRKFGAFSGKQEIEAIAVDDTLGYVYYSDETVGIRKYYADPALGNQELALFGVDGFKEDQEGIALWPTGKGAGYLTVSDQQANAFRLFPRGGRTDLPHEHPYLSSLLLSTQDTDGCEFAVFPFNQQFPEGFFIAMSSNKTFQLYDIRRLKTFLPAE